MQRRGAAISDSTPVWRTMFVFLIPLMLGNWLQSLSGTFTSIFLGQLIGVGALAAASSIFPMLFFLISFFFGIASGSTVVIGQAYGANDQARLKRAVGTTITSAIVLGVIFGGVGFVFGRAILMSMGTPADILEPALAYAHVVFAMLPITFVYLGYSTFLRGIGDSRTPFIMLLATTIVSVALTPLFIRGGLGVPALGIAGAPLANLVAQASGTAGLLVWLELRRNPLALSNLRNSFGIEIPLLMTLIRIGIPTGVQMVMISLSEVAVISFVNHFGSHATAAYGAVNQIVGYVQFPAMTIGIAASIFGAQSIGARRLDRLAKIVRAAVTLNYVITSILIVLVYFFGRRILMLFVTDASTVNIAHDLLSITLWSYVIFGNTSVLSGLMRASGAVIWPTAISIGTIWGVEVPVAYVLSHGPLGLRGVWIAYPIAFIVSLALQSSYYFFVWRKRPIVALDAAPAPRPEAEALEPGPAA